MTDKTQQLHIRVSDSEKEFIKARASAANISISEYIVSLSKEKKIFSMPELPELVWQISKIGTNINQIAAAANSKKYASQADIEKSQEYLKQIIDIVSKILTKVRGYDELPPVSTDEKFDKKLDKLNRDIYDINRKLGELVNYVMKKE